MHCPNCSTDNKRFVHKDEQEVKHFYCTNCGKENEIYPGDDVYFDYGDE